MDQIVSKSKFKPNALKYFREEYEAHVHEKRCPGMICRALIAYYIDLDKCARGCDACVGCCPTEAVFTTSTFLPFNCERAKFSPLISFTVKS